MKSCDKHLFASAVVADSMLMSYESVPTESLPGGTTNFTTTVQWKPSSSVSSKEVDPSLHLLSQGTVDKNSLFSKSFNNFGQATV